MGACLDFSDSGLTENSALHHIVQVPNILILHNFGDVEEAHLVAKKKTHENIGWLVVDNLYVEKNNINKNKCGCASVDEKLVKYSVCIPCSLKGSKFSASTRLSWCKSPPKAGDECGIIILQKAVLKPANNSRSLNCSAFE